MTDFGELLRRLRLALVERVRNGELTERSLARRAGLSQAHVHNVLSGRRVLTSTVADRLMSELRMSVFDLVGAEELAGELGNLCRGCRGRVARMRALRVRGHDERRLPDKR